MNSFLGVNTSEAKEKLVKLINSEVEERIAMQEAVINKLKGIHLDYDKIESMFKKLTVDTVAKNSINYAYYDHLDCGKQFPLPKTPMS